ncbi:MAG: hypothetical protein FWD85_12695 [Microbacteriaceae bacterium]|nr:hypothetical protein [Microbacteriaceae bacterium]MCL2796150.1 hypothetical protein [Microbacteriaceae bacterium]
MSGSVLELDAEACERMPFERFLAAVEAAVPEARARLEALGIPAAVQTASLADIDRKVRVYGDNGIRGWVVGLLRGDVVQLGRLQFERAAGVPGRAVHIPELGPLDPVAVDEAFATARRFFGDGRRFVCTSWLLDPRLQQLGAGSNIVAFQNRFEPVPGAAPEGATAEGEEGDEAVAKFAFGVPLHRLDRRAAPATTPVQRIVAGVWRAGGAWREPTGLLAEPRPSADGVPSPLTR